jgi:hypothetical protein
MKLCSTAGDDECMEKVTQSNNAGKRGGGVILNGVVTGSLVEKVTFEPRCDLNRRLCSLLAQSITLLNVYT